MLTSLSPLSPYTFEVKELLERVIILFKPKTEAQNVEWDVSIRESSLLFTSDFEKIEQVLINLIKNALEAMADKRLPVLKIYAGIDCSHPFITISDNGAGIAPEILDTIFTPFFTTKSTGTVIGQSLSRQIMSLHKGTIQGFSEVGEGTRVEMLIV